MYEYWRNDFVETAVNYAGASKEKALELWDSNRDNFIEDIHVAADALMQEIFEKERSGI